MAKLPDQRIQSAAEVAEVLAPLTFYAEGSKSSSPQSRTERPIFTIDISSPHSEQSTAQPVATPVSSPPQEQTERQHVPLVQPVAPSDHTPRPRDLPNSLHAVAETDSPFSMLNEPPSEPQSSARPKEQPKALSPLTKGAYLWIAAYLLALALGAFAFWLAVRD
jgi:hypothetical protein